VGSKVTSFHGYGMGSYSFFNQGVNIYAAHAFEVPTTLAAGSLPRLADDLPRCREWFRRHPACRERHGRLIDDRQPRHPGHRGELPLTVSVARTSAWAIKLRISGAELDALLHHANCRPGTLGRLQTW